MRTVCSGEEVIKMDDLIIDCFAGGGGASVGIEMALGRQVDIAINHDPDAILMHKTNPVSYTHLDVYKRQVLKATVEALGKLNKNCQVAIYTDNDYVKSMYETELDKWEQKDFKARTGRDIASREEWQAISAYRRQHVIRFF